MNPLVFSLGITCGMVVVLMLAVVYLMFRIREWGGKWKEVETLDRRISDEVLSLQRFIDSNQAELHIALDEMNRDLSSNTDELYRYVDKGLEDTNRYINEADDKVRKEMTSVLDSRVDKAIELFKK